MKRLRLEDKIHLLFSALFVAFVVCLIAGYWQLALYALWAIPVLSSVIIIVVCVIGTYLDIVDNKNK